MDHATQGEVAAAEGFARPAEGPYDDEREPEYEHPVDGVYEYDEAAEGAVSVAADEYEAYEQDQGGEGLCEDRYAEEEEDEEDPELEQATKEVHKAFGRDTALGRSLFNLYNKGRVDYSPNVRVRAKKDALPPSQEHMLKRLERAKRDRQRRAAAAAVVPGRRRTAVPRSAPFFDRGQGRKAGRKIEAEMRREFPSAHELKQRPRPRRHFPSREEEIARLQERCENPDKPRKLRPVRARAPAPAPAPAPTPAQLRRERFAEVEAEIAEREDFLSEMRELGALDPDTRDTVKGEIADRVRQLRRLDAAMAADA